MRRIYLAAFLILIGASLTDIIAQNLTDPTAVVRKAEEKLRGRTSSESTMRMTIVRPDWEREMEMKSWSYGDDHAMILITSPAREQGISYLKLYDNMWNWQPNIERVVKFPPSMMGQAWMGSDLTNDDLVRQSSLVNDFEHRFITITELNEEMNPDSGAEIEGYSHDDKGNLMSVPILSEEEKNKEPILFEGLECYVVELLPKEDANVVWSKVRMWIDKKDFIELKSEFYDEDGFLVNMIVGKDVKMIGGRKLPTRLEVSGAEGAKSMTVIEYLDIQFDTRIDKSFFTQQRMRRLK